MADILIFVGPFMDPCMFFWAVFCVLSWVCAEILYWEYMSSYAVFFGMENVILQMGFSCFFFFFSQCEKVKSATEKCWKCIEFVS